MRNLTSSPHISSISLRFKSVGLILVSDTLFSSSSKEGSRIRQKLRPKKDKERSVRRRRASEPRGEGEGAPASMHTTHLFTINGWPHVNVTSALGRHTLEMGLPDSQCGLEPGTRPL